MFEAVSGKLGNKLEYWVVPLNETSFVDPYSIMATLPKLTLGVVDKLRLQKEGGRT